MSDLANRLAQDIRDLMATPVNSKEDLNPWIDKADLIRANLRTIYQHLDPFITEELEHYFSDPDIRLKDPDYKVYQNKIIEELLTDLETGKIDEKLRSRPRPKIMKYYSPVLLILRFIAVAFILWASYDFLSTLSLFLWVQPEYRPGFRSIAIAWLTKTFLCALLYFTAPFFSRLITRGT